MNEIIKKINALPVNSMGWISKRKVMEILTEQKEPCNCEWKNADTCKACGLDKEK